MREPGPDADDVGRITADAAAIAEVVAASPGAEVGCYDGWTVTRLAAHVGQIHRWVTGIVEQRVSSRPSTPYAEPPAGDDMAAWVVAGAEPLVAALADGDPQDAVWTISRTDRTLGFWRRRMVLETALHRWDAEDAARRSPVVSPAVAAAGVLETLDVYLAQRLDGADVRGDGERVAVVTTDTEDAWTLSLSPEAVRFEEGADDVDAVVRGTALDLWLLLTCRRSLDGLDVEGDRPAAELAVRAASLSPGPAG